MGAAHDGAAPHVHGLKAGIVFVECLTGLACTAAARGVVEDRERDGRARARAGYAMASPLPGSSTLYSVTTAYGSPSRMDREIVTWPSAAR